MGHGRDNGLEGQDGAGGLHDLGLQFDLEEHVYGKPRECGLQDWGEPASRSMRRSQESCQWRRSGWDLGGTCDSKDQGGTSRGRRTRDLDRTKRSCVLDGFRRRKG